MKEKKAVIVFNLAKQLCIVSLIICSCKGKTQNMTTEKYTGIKKQLDSLFTKLHTDGLLNGNVLIASGDTVIYQNSFGIADHSTGRKLNDSSVFELASVSKQFTAMSIVLLKEKGKLKYEDSLRHFFPELSYAGITVKHLLHHTSGLPDYMELVMNSTAPGGIATNADMIRLLAEKKPKALFNPGDKWEYSNTGYALLAGIIEKVSGKSFADFLKENIFIPLGMTHTEIYRRRYEKRMIDNYALGYMQPESKKWTLPDSLKEVAAMVTSLDGIVGDGTVNSTTGDLLKWSVALDKNILVPKSVQDEIFAQGSLNNGEKHNYGYGWMVGNHEKTGRIVSHGGGWPGYGTYIEKHIDKGKTIIILSNHDRPMVNIEAISNILYGIKAEIPKEVKLDEVTLKQYEGRYEIDPDFIITITVENGKIYEQASGQAKLEIYPWKEDLFFLKEVDARLKFVRNDKKEITGLALLQNGQEMPGKKIK